MHPVPWFGIISSKHDNHNIRAWFYRCLQYCQGQYTCLQTAVRYLVISSIPVWRITIFKHCGATYSKVWYSVGVSKQSLIWRKRVSTRWNLICLDVVPGAQQDSQPRWCYHQHMIPELQPTHKQKREGDRRRPACSTSWRNSSGVAKEKSQTK